MAERDPENAYFSAYNGAIPAEVDSSPPASPSYPTFDFKVMILRGRDLFTLPDAGASHAGSGASVYVQMQVLDAAGVAIAPHFKYKSTVKPGPHPEWCESVLLKHLPVQPAQLEFTFHLVPPATAASPATGGALLGSLITPASLIAHYHPKQFRADASVYSRYHRVTGGASPANAQFHYVLAPSYARLRHLTTAQAQPPSLSSSSSVVSPVRASAAVQPVSVQASNGTPKPALPGRDVSPAPPFVPKRALPKPPSPQLPSHPPPLPPPPLITQQSLAALTSSLPPSLPLLDTASPPHASHSSMQFTANPMLAAPAPLPSPTPVAPPSEADIAAEALLTEAEREKRASMRARAVQEFYDTERSYFVNLGILYNEFVCPLRLAVKEGRLRLPDGGLEAMVNNVETIYSFHMSFLADLERKGKEDGGGGGGDPVSAVVLKYSPFFKLYMIYLNGYEASLSAMTSLRSHRRFQEFLHKMRERLNEISILDLTSYLILPVQRVPRYVLLLSEIRRHTGPLHPEYGQLCAALDSIKAVAAYVNEGKRHVENLSKLVDVQERVSGSGVPQLVEPYRRWIREGVMTRISSGWGGTIKEKRGVFFLFSDLLLWSSMDHVYKGSVWLVSACLDRKGERQLEVTSAKSHLLVRCDSEAEYGSWADDIQRCIDDLQLERNKHRVLYRDLKSRRKVNGNAAADPNANPSGSTTPTAQAASGTATPLHSVDAAVVAVGPAGHTDKDAMHSLIAVKLRELQLKKETEGLGASEDSRTLSVNQSQSAYHTHHPSVDAPTPSSAAAAAAAGAEAGTVIPSPSAFPSHVGALERRAWRSPTMGSDGGVAEAAVKGMVSSTPNVCLCYDREEGRRNSAKLAKAFDPASDEAKEQRRSCPIHRLPDA